MNKVNCIMLSEGRISVLEVAQGDELERKLQARERFEAIESLTGDWGDLVTEYDGLDNWKEFVE